MTKSQLAQQARDAWVQLAGYHLKEDGTPSCSYSVHVLAHAIKSYLSRDGAGEGELGITLTDVEVALRRAHLVDAMCFLKQAQNGEWGSIQSNLDSMHRSLRASMGLDEAFYLKILALAQGGQRL